MPGNEGWHGSPLRLAGTAAAPLPAQARPPVRRGLAGAECDIGAGGGKDEFWARTI